MDLERGHQERLFPGQLMAFIAQVSWRPGEGWRLTVQSWTEDEQPDQGYKERYSHLTADECQDVLAAEVALRCDWIASRASA